MADNYPDNWISRVHRAPKLIHDPADGQYRSPDGAVVVASDEVGRMTSSYLREEARRRKLRKLSKEDERVCQDFVLLVDNWRTGRWNVPTTAVTWTHGPKPRGRAEAPRAQTMSAAS